jgi:hypothetical protein
MRRDLQIWKPDDLNAVVRCCRTLLIEGEMEYDRDKADDMVLALLCLTMFKDHVGVRAWKDQNWETMDRLFAKGYISDPKSKAKSVVVTEEGAKRSKQLFEDYFSKR